MTDWNMDQVVLDKLNKKKDTVKRNSERLFYLKKSSDCDSGTHRFEFFDRELNDYICSYCLDIFNGRDIIFNGSGEKHKTKDGSICR